MSVSLRVKNASGTTLSIDVDLDGSVGNLKQKIAEAFKILTPFNILTGYPPTICSLPDDTLIQGNFTANEILRTHCTELANSEPAKPAAQKKSARLSKKPATITSNSSSSNSGSGRIFTSSSSSSSSSSNSNKCTTPSFGGRIMTLSGPARMKSPSSSVASARSNSRLPVTIATRKPRRSIGVRNKQSSGDGKEDICSALMSAAEGGAGGRSKALRSVFRSAVAHQYDDSLAVSRLRAAFAGRYSFEESLDNRVLGTGVSSKMNVTFPLRPESHRSAMHTESVDMLPAELLRAVLLAALEDDGGEGSREFLKPVNMSRSSPRIFWSLIKAFGSDISSALSQLFPQVLDWSWLSDRKRGLSERALENQQQALEHQAAASSRKRARESKKKGIVPPADQAAVVDLTINENSCNSVEIGLNDSTIASALREQLHIDTFVPDCWLHSLTQHLGGNSSLLLADLDFEDPLCLKKIDEIHKASSSSSSSSSSSPPQVLSEDSLEAWVASAQTCVVHTIMKALHGGCRRLQRALHTLGQHAPSNLRAWRLMPELLYQRLLEADLGLATTCLTRCKGPSGEEVTELFTVDWVQWMCGVCEDMRQSPSLLWMDRFNYDDEDDDEDEDEEVADDAAEGGWIYVNDGSNSVGCTVRCYPLSDDYWDDGIVTGYLPPDEDEPTALWRVQGDRVSKPPSATDGAESDPGSSSSRKRWTLDLEEQELADAQARHASVNVN